MVKKESFETALVKLEEIVLKLEREVPLAEAMLLYKKGAELVGRCQKMLDEGLREVYLLKQGQLSSFDPEKEENEA